MAFVGTVQMSSFAISWWHRTIFMTTLAMLMVGANAESSLPPDDGVCKGGPIPAGWVPIRELWSPECEPATSPFDRNAWELGQLKDDVESCLEPNYSEDFPPNLSYVVVRKTLSKKCPARKDGTPNTFVLRHWSNTIATPEANKNADCPGMIVGGKCSPSARLVPENEKPRLWRANTTNLRNLVHVRVQDLIPWVLTGPGINPTSNSKKLERYIESPISAEFWPMCAEWNSAIWKMRDPNVVLDRDYVAHVFVVHRIFHDPMCPQQRYGDLNAMVLRLIDTSDYQRFPPSELSKGGFIRHCLSPTFDGSEEMSVAYYDDACGINRLKRANAIKVKSNLNEATRDAIGPPPPPSSQEAYPKNWNN